MQVLLGICPKATYMDCKPLLLTYNEAASILSCSTRTIRRLVKAGKLFEVRITRDAPRFRREDIESLVSSNDGGNLIAKTRLSQYEH